MSSPERPDDSPSAPHVPHLVEEYRTERLRWLEHARELERLRSEVRTAAGREAETILTAARSDIRRVVQDARRELLVLVGQVQAVGCEEEGAPAGPLEDAREAAVTARRGLQRVLAEAKADLRALSEEASLLRAEVARSPNPRPVAPRVLFQPTPLESEPEPEPAAVGEPPAEARFVRLRMRRPHVIGGALGAAAAVILAIFLSRPAENGAPAAAVIDEQGATAADEAEEPEPEPPAPPPPAAPVNETAFLVVEATRPVWVRTEVDGDRDRGRTLRAGQVLRFSPSRDIVVRVGDAGALLVAAPGETPRRLGADGEVITRRLTPPRSSRETDQAAAAPVIRSSDVASTALVAPAAGAPGGPQGRSGPAAVLPLARTGEGTAGLPASAPGVAPVGAAAGTPASDEAIIRVREQEWFDAYYRDDRAALGRLTTTRFSLTDERSPANRISPGAGRVERTIHDVHIVVSGNGAVLSAQVKERVTGPAGTRESVSWVSEVWIQEVEGWKLMGVRLRDTPGPPPQP